MDEEPTKIPIKTDAEDSAACGPGCSCGKSPLSAKAKTVVSLLILAVVLGIVFYKAVNSGAGSCCAAPADDPITAVVGSNPLKPGQKIWENLESLGNLNVAAVNQDAVFVYIPAKNSDHADGKINEAVFASQQALGAKGVNLGLYALKTNSPDYAALASQYQLPTILVASKGKGMTNVSGDVTETKLLQAYVTSSRAGGCGCGSGTGKAAAGRKCPVKN